ncbi:MAG: hypothetical protein CMJ85_03230 [Planctomycetes bacterium]|nr:hypothetical protein [Planctomycetota bacterium]
MAYVALAAIVLLATARVMAFPYSPEGWNLLATMREVGVLECLLPDPDHGFGPYYRPVWFTYWKCCDVLGLGSGGARTGVAALHVAATLLIYRVLRRTSLAPGSAWTMALLAGIAPGTASALSWFAAGNKVFALFFLALATCLVREANRPRTWWLAAGAAALAIGSAENAYLAVPLLPLVALTTGHRRAAVVLGGGVLAIAVLHLFVLSPQRSAGVDDRTGQLLAAIGSDAIGWFGSVTDNLGRFFLHGIGVADDASSAGKILLAILFLWALLVDVPGLGNALGAFLLLNVPATLFPFEASRHQAYLPAIGAGLVLGCVVTRLRGRARIGVTLMCVAACSVQGYRTQSLWQDHLGQAERMLASTETAMPQAPPTKPILINMPEEYRAAFRLRFGDAVEAQTWPAFLVLSTRSELLVPAEFELPKGSGTVLEYDGQGVVRTTWDAFRARARAPLAWLAPSIDAFENPARAWDEIVGHDGPLREISRNFVAAPQRGKPGGKATVRLLTKGPLALPSVRFWEIEAEVENGRWLILGWLPLKLPATQEAWIKFLKPLPWLFEVRVSDLDNGKPVDTPTSPAIGFLPAVWLEPGRHRLRVELAVRGT